MPASNPLPEKPAPLPVEATEIVTAVLHGEMTFSRIDASFLAWKALSALQDAGYPIRWTCSGCCNCWPSNFTDPLCDGNGHPIKAAA